jgi:BirA family biotin operon repressor/biotin-[acetyl-CoA-carboxylase] ligase
MNQPMLANLLADLPLGSLRYFDSVGSTNEVAARWAEAGAPDLSLVVADEQTAGRGRSGRRWITPAGSALAFSLILRPQEWLPSAVLVTGEGNRQTWAEGSSPDFALTRLSALGALAVCEALHQCRLLPQIKWPNDVLLMGRKVAGVLVEMQWHGEEPRAAILGIGINVASSSVPDEHMLDFPATSLETVLQRSVDRWELLRDVLRSVMKWRFLWMTTKFLQVWEENLAFRGEPVRILSAGAQAIHSVVLEGTLMGLFPDGSLKIRTPEGEIRAAQFGELHLRPQRDEPTPESVSRQHRSV